MYEVTVFARGCKSESSEERRCYQADTGDIPPWIKDLKNVAPLTPNGPPFAVLPPSGDNCYCNATNACNNKVVKSSSERTAARWTTVMIISACVYVVAFITRNY